MRTIRLITNYSAAAVGVVLVMCLGLCAPMVEAQGQCSMKSLEGTYAIYEKGNSFLLNTAVPSPLQWSGLHFHGDVAPFANVAIITFGPDGVGNGFHWIWIGALNGGLDPIPLQATIEEMNDDCTGKIKYAWNLPAGLPPATVMERIIVFDNGREFRSLPMYTQDSVPGLAWIGTGRRIRKADEALGSCGPQTAQGSYVMSCQNLVKSGLADTLLLRMDISITGDYTGRLYEKMGSLAPIDIPVSGTMAVNSDCSFAGTVVVPAINAVLVQRGVFIDEGKQWYSLLLYNINKPPELQGLKYTACEGIRTGQ